MSKADLKLLVRIMEDEGLLGEHVFGSLRLGDSIGSDDDDDNRVW